MAAPQPLDMKQDWLSSYREHGFALLKGQISELHLNALEQELLTQLSHLASDYNIKNIPQSARSPEFAALLAQHRELERALYDAMMKSNIKLQTALCSDLVEPAQQILGNSIGVFERLPFRIDLPLVMRELAVWHQDNHYVKGNTDIVTSWVPLQDTPYELGCLLVMPDSHKLGKVEHDRNLLQKKYVPSSIFNRPAYYVEMERGDVLIFNALLLHSSGNNISDCARLSFQPRFSRMDDENDPAMGRIIPVEHAATASYQ